MVSRSKYRKLEDLYVEGTELELEDDLVIYLKPLNGLQQEEARSHAQAARSRLVLALRDDESDEQAKLDAKFAVDGRDSVIEQLSYGEANMELPKIMQRVRDSEEWSEKMDMVEQHEELPEATADEERVVAEVNRGYLEEVAAQLETETEHSKMRLERMDEDALKERFREFWIERRGGSAAMDAYQVTEFMYAARACDGKKGEDGWDHSACDSHRERVWETREDIRGLPERLHGELSTAMELLDMSVREGKDSGSRQSSSGSSLSTSVPEESTPSTPVETSEKPPGSSSSPSTTP